MHLRGIALSLLLLLTACQSATALPTATSSPTPAFTSATCPAGDHTQELTSGGQVRRYILHVPPAYQPETPAALVLGFHGAGSNSGEFESYSGFSAVSDREGFLVAYPLALGEHPTWNTATGLSNWDIQFVRDLITDLEGRCNIDSNRIFASGHSNGGGMANRLACDLADRIAAIGSVSGAYQWSEQCAPSRPVAILAVHGSADPVIPYNGFPDMTNEPPAAHFIIGIPIPQWASAWAKRNGCKEEPPSAAEKEQVTRKQWGNCQEGADVILYTIEGGGHGWPQAFDAAQTIWDFFVQHPLVR